LFYDELFCQIEITMAKRKSRRQNTGM